MMAAFSWRTSTIFHDFKESIHKFYCHRIHSVNIDRLEYNVFRLKIQQELHIGRESQQLTVPANIIVSEFNDLFYPIFIRML